MGFFDVVKKGAAIANKGLEIGDKSIKILVAKQSDAELLKMDSSNKHVREELQKRRL